MSVDAGDVLKSFYKLREQYTGKRDPGWQAEGALEDARLFVAWCRSEEISDPVEFMRYRFECAKHSNHPLGMRSMKSGPAAERWRKWMEGRYLEQRASEQLHREAGSRQQQHIKSLRFLTIAHEAAKLPYAQSGNRELCLAQLELTGGYHPMSKICLSCPLSIRCAGALYQRHGFDVVSLRAGRLHALPKEIAAAAVR